MSGARHGSVSEAPRPAWVGLAALDQRLRVRWEKYPETVPDALRFRALDGRWAVQARHEVDGADAQAADETASRRGHRAQEQSLADAFRYVERCRSWMQNSTDANLTLKRCSLGYSLA